MTQRKFFTSLSLWRLRGYSNVRLILGRKIVFVRHQYGHQELKGVAKEKLNRVLAIALLLNCPSELPHVKGAGYYHLPSMLCTYFGVIVSALCDENMNFT